MEVKDCITLFENIFNQQYVHTYPKANDVFMHGNCFDFALLLKRYYDGILVIEDTKEESTHCAFYYEGKQYDIEGEKSCGFYRNTFFREVTNKDTEYMKRCFYGFKSIPSDLVKIEENYLDILFITEEVYPYQRSLEQNLSFLEAYQCILFKEYGECLYKNERIDISKRMSAFLLAYLEENRMIEGIEGMILLAISSVFKRYIEKMSDIFLYKNMIDSSIIPFKQCLYSYLQHFYTACDLEVVLYRFYQDLFSSRKEFLKEKEEHKSFCLKARNS